MDVYRLLKNIISHPELHARWLNTLSFMENAGARKISAAEHASEVSLIQLKHAAEEHRHAYYLKKQISKLSPDLCRSYQSHELLAARATRQYLHALDVKTCRYLRNHYRLSPDELKYAAYLFVTYAIEVRADLLYQVYQDILTETGSKIMVKSIILEEEGHLEEMISQLCEFSPKWKDHADCIVSMEEELHQEWLNSISNEIRHHDYA